MGNIIQILTLLWKLKAMFFTVGLGPRLLSVILPGQLSGGPQAGSIEGQLNKQGLERLRKLHEVTHCLRSKDSIPSLIPNS